MKNFTKLFLIMLLAGAALGLQAQYCAPPGFLSMGGVGEPFTGITNVTLGTLDNSSVWNDGATTSDVYTYHSSATVPDLQQGSAANISVTIQINVGNQNNTKVWIDWNQDQDFDDSGEELKYWVEHTAGVQPTSFNVPAGATLGTTRMRIATDMSEGQGHIIPEPCGYLNYPSHNLKQHGEIEDYDVNITASTGMKDNNSASSTFVIIPNVNGGVQVAYNLSKGANVVLDIYNVIGQKISTVTDGIQSAGSYSYTVDNAQLSNANIYFATLKVDDTIITKKFVLR